MSKYTIYIASDSMSFLGLESLVKLAASRFTEREYEVVKIPNVMSAAKALETVLEAKDNQPSIVVFNTSLIEVRDAFIMNGLKYRVQFLDVLAPMVKALGNVLKMPPVYQPSYSWQLDEKYFEKINAIEFAINNDDGRSLASLQKADIVLIGVSRTSKTPLSIYLAYHNYLVVNIPLVSVHSIPAHIFKISPKKIIGLTIHPDRLSQIRTERNTNMGVAGDSAYADMHQILEELELADSLMKKLGCPIIDVSNKAVEETAEIIMKLTTNQTIRSYE
ncbi:phosphoenolpyruvate synthase regulatory protein [Echinicola pacifica]|uniref:Phosphoenolpyruvate synthase regulatory protein n=1 Tax=Echinicola pacifica TaxID=346377 RepID=A0A918UVL9_9BACT|nr:pyruvate, water dikinase regulatory protein [Echinicola pacifica]GGZ37563.1 phosphoenolpyruvate synthase regulatory protein [Echinicola pacifica]